MITTVVVAMTTVWRSDAVTPAPRATGRSPEQHDQLRASDSRDIFDKQTSQFEVARQHLLQNNLLCFAWLEIFNTK